jgi:GTP:adenosylcobinamide-phosphate guanylyltransferase
MNAVITAGGRVSGEYARASGTDVKALALVRGTTMLARVISSLREAGVERIAVVGGDDVRRACEDSVELIIPEAPRGSENVIAALRAWPEYHEPLLYATSDMPYVTTEAAADFISRVPHGNVAISLCEFRAFVERFPEAPSGFGIKLAGERVVNGGLFCIPAGSGDRLATIAAEFFDARKQPWRMVRLINPASAFRFAIGALSIGHLEVEATRIAGVAASAVRGCAPELGFDADDAAEYEYANEHA